MNQKQIAQALGVSVQSIANWEKQGMPVERTPGILKPKYNENEIREWLANRHNDRGEK